MAKLQRRDIDRPDELREVAGGKFAIYELAGHDVSWQSVGPGWRWSESVKPIAGTEYCEFHHVGFTLSGRARIQLRDGAELEIGPHQFFEVPPFHDAWVIGEEPWVAIDWGQNVGFARADGTAAGRVIATLLMTDIVDSTATALGLGDARWRDLLAEHNRIIRTYLERYRGRETSTTGDGVVAIFDSAERAIHAGLSIAAAMPAIGLGVRCGVHTGEIELDADNVRGLSVHVAARVVELAGAGEVLASWTTRELLSASKLVFSERGTHQLKGLAEPKTLYAVRQRD